MENSKEYWEDLVRFWTENPNQECRFNYYLDEDSVVVDVGGYKGKWAEKIYSLYMPVLHIFEPHPKYFKHLEEKFKNFIDVYVWDMCISNTSLTMPLSDEGEKSNMFVNSDKMHEVQAVRASEAFSDEKIDLMKINAEGAEYFIIADLAYHNLLRNIKDIQVQFHLIGGFGMSDFQNMQNTLSKTHELTYDYGLVWQNWRLKE